MCYHAQFVRSALKGVGITTGEPQNLGALELCSFGMGGAAEPRYTPLPDMCYHVKFGSSANPPHVYHVKLGIYPTNSVPINRRNPEIGSAEAPPLRVWRG